MPSFLSLRKQFPKSKITVAVRKKAKELIDDCPLIDDVVVVDKKSGPIYKQVIGIGLQIKSWRSAGYDMVIDLREKGIWW